MRQQIADRALHLIQQLARRRLREAARVVLRQTLLLAGQQVQIWMAISGTKAAQG